MITVTPSFRQSLVFKMFLRPHENEKLAFTNCCYNAGTIFSNLVPVRSSSEKFENGVFTLKTNELFSVYPTLEKFKNANDKRWSFRVCD